MNWLYWLDFVFLFALVSALCWFAYLGWVADHE